MLSLLTGDDCVLEAEPLATLAAARAARRLRARRLLAADGHAARPRRAEPAVGRRRRSVGACMTAAAAAHCPIRPSGAAAASCSPATPGSRARGSTCWLRELGAEVMGDLAARAADRPVALGAARPGAASTDVRADITSGDWMGRVRDFAPAGRAPPRRAVARLGRLRPASAHLRGQRAAAPSGCSTACRRLDGVDATLVITTDKVYDPASAAPHDESHPLRRPRARTRRARPPRRSSSQAGRAMAAPRATARAGNVIGGGDWAAEPAAARPRTSLGRRRLAGAATAPRASGRGSTCSSRCGATSSTSRRSRADATLPRGPELRAGRRAVRPRRRARGVRRAASGSGSAASCPIPRGPSRRERRSRRRAMLTLDSRLAAEQLGWSSVLDWQAAVTLTLEWYRRRARGRGARRAARRPPAGRLLLDASGASVTERRDGAERALAARRRDLPRLRRARRSSRSSTSGCSRSPTSCCRTPTRPTRVSRCTCGSAASCGLGQVGEFVAAGADLRRLPVPLVGQHVVGRARAGYAATMQDELGAGRRQPRRRGRQQRRLPAAGVPRARRPGARHRAGRQRRRDRAGAGVRDADGVLRPRDGRARCVAEHGHPRLVVANNVHGARARPRRLRRRPRGAVRRRHGDHRREPVVRDAAAETQFDTIYHEHFSYLSAHAVARGRRRARARAGPVEQLHDARRLLPLHDRAGGRASPTPSVAPPIERSCAAGCSTPQTWRAFAERSRAAIVGPARPGSTSEPPRAARVAGYGAAAKGNTLLNAAGVPARPTSRVVADGSAEKQGKFLPGTGVPVVAPARWPTTNADRRPRSCRGTSPSEIVPILARARPGRATAGSPSRRCGRSSREGRAARHSRRDAAAGRAARGRARSVPPRRRHARCSTSLGLDGRGRAGLDRDQLAARHGPGAALPGRAARGVQDAVVHARRGLRRRWSTCARTSRRTVAGSRSTSRRTSRSRCTSRRGSPTATRRSRTTPRSTYLISDAVRPRERAQPALGRPDGGHRVAAAGDSVISERDREAPPWPPSP